MVSAIIEQLETFGPDRCERMGYDEAAEYTRRLAEGLYENFIVVSWLLPRRLREDFRNIYAFCRWADDLGDETGDRGRSLDLLRWWRTEIDSCYEDQPRHPVFVALHRTVRRHDIPRQPFDDLVDAFVQDQKVIRYATWDQVLDYCKRSANPVGRLVLYVCGYRDEQRQRLSDATCTALQLANFWQDVRRDILDRDRVYVPEDVAWQHGLSIEAMVSAVRSSVRAGLGGASGSEHREQTASLVDILGPATATIRDLVERTWPLFEQGRGLIPLVDPQVRTDIELFTRGGESILRMIRKQGYDTLTHRPSLGKAAKAALLMRALVRKAFRGRGRASKHEGASCG